LAAEDRSVEKEEPTKLDSADGGNAEYNLISSYASDNETPEMAREVDKEARTSETFEEPVPSKFDSEIPGDIEDPVGKEELDFVQSYDPVEEQADVQPPETISEAAELRHAHGDEHIARSLEEDKDDIPGGSSRDILSTEQATATTKTEQPRASHDIDFAATLAAGLADSGFNPDLVINDPVFHRRSSPPGVA